MKYAPLSEPVILWLRRDLDANMFVRIMAPLSQSKKFDAAAYIRQWVPELQSLSVAEIHDPGLMRPRGYPPRIIEHTAARARALAAYDAMKQA